MTAVALVGPEIEESLSMRALAGSLAQAGYATDIVSFSGEHAVGSANLRGSGQCAALVVSNVFGAGKRRDLARVSALAGVLERHGIRRFASVVTAEAADVDRELFQRLRDRLRVLRVDLSVSGASSRSKPRHDQGAVELLRELDLYGCLILPSFTRGATLELLRNACDFPFQLLRDASAERADLLSAAVLRERLRARVASVRFEVEVCRHFQPARYQRSWRAEALSLTRALGESSVQVVECILQHVSGSAPGPHDAQLVAELARDVQAVELQLGAAATDLRTRVAHALGHARPSTRFGVMRTLDAHAPQ